MSQLVNNIKVQNLNHLGILAGIIDEIGIVEIINEQLGVHPQEKLSSGLIVKSIILNAMGFVSRPLYLFPQFFNDKATEHLFGEGILPEDFNDDKIGRVLDKLYEFGLDKIFLAISLKACQIYGIERSYSHLDSTSISVEGDYLICSRENEENLEPIPIKIVHGHSKDKRPDLKQFLINLIVSNDAGVPLFLECGNGNDSDKAKFAELLSNFKKEVDLETIFVADSALYSKDNLILMKDLKWITRVPLSIAAASLYVREIPDAEFIETDLQGYKAVQKDSNYAGIKQKWLSVQSEARKESDLKKISKNLLKDEEKAKALLKSLLSKKYENRTEIKAVLKCEQKKLKYHILTLQDISETTDKKTKKIVYKASITLELNRGKIEDERKKAHRLFAAVR